MSRVYTLYLPHPIPRAGFSLNRRQPEPSPIDRATHPYPSSTNSLARTNTTASSSHLLLPLRARNQLDDSPFLFLPCFIPSFTSLHRSPCARACARRFCERAFNDSHFRFRNETVLWQRSTALGRPENGAVCLPAQSFPRMSLSRAATQRRSPLSLGKQENFIANLV